MLANTEAVADQHADALFGILDGEDAPGFALDIAFGEAAFGIAEPGIGSPARSGHETSVERPNLAGELALIDRYPGKRILACLRARDALGGHERDHHARGFLEPGVEYAFDLVPRADIDPADGKQPDQTRCRHQDQEQSRPQRRHNASARMR